MDGWNRPLPEIGDKVAITWSAIDHCSVGLVTKLDIMYPGALSVSAAFPAGTLEETVAVVKNVKGWLMRHPEYTKTLEVKHRDSGPRDYLLAFEYEEGDLKKNDLVRIYWLAKETKDKNNTGVALKIHVIGSVTYNN